MTDRDSAGGVASRVSATFTTSAGTVVVVDDKTLWHFEDGFVNWVFEFESQLQMDEMNIFFNSDPVASLPCDDGVIREMRFMMIMSDHSNPFPRRGTIVYTTVDNDLVVPNDS